MLLHIKGGMAAMAILLALLVLNSTSHAAEVLSLGIFPRRNVEDTIRMFTPLAEHLEEKLGIQVRLKTSRNFENFQKHVANKRFDIVHYNPYHYIKSAKEHGYRVILKNVERGIDKHAGAIFVHKNSGIEHIDQLNGKRIIFGGGPTAMFSYLLPTYMLRQNGLKDGDYTKEYAISPPSALFSAYYGHADAAGAGEVVIEFDVVKRKIDTSQLHAIAVSKALTHLPWAVRGDLQHDVARKIQTILSGLSGTEEGQKVLKTAGLTGLNISDDTEYDEHRKITWQVLRENYCIRECNYVEKPADSSEAKHADMNKMKQAGTEK
ncbi:MAG: phosphate/phosphite/phosphonate ABC transporter substrate-binding protein [Gammaproteobacteria bacterium]|nr:MAG: phosphate/phosphite/phosphonate ABC transporter substrate-binding protein [Gammaproteobacteria bacterium]